MDCAGGGASLAALLPALCLRVTFDRTPHFRCGAGDWWAPVPGDAAALRFRLSFPDLSEEYATIGRDASVTSLENAIQVWLCEARCHRPAHPLLRLAYIS